MSSQYPDVVVIGSGPNGLAAAVTAARAGLRAAVYESQPSPGGGARTVDLGLADGIVHDVCSAVHPLAAASPFFSAFDLPARGVDLLVPEASYAHPLEDEPAAVAWHSAERTADELGVDGSLWRGLFSSLLKAPDAVVALGLGTKREVPQELLSRRGAAAALSFVRSVAELSGPGASRFFSGTRARALLAGVAAHSPGRLGTPSSAGVGLMLAMTGHVGGWPIPRGGSQVIVDALTADLEAHGGSLVTDTHISNASQLPPAKAYLCDTSAAAAAEIFGDRLPASVKRSMRAMGHGSGVAKVDFVLSGPVPWRDPDVGRAGTVHVGGTRSEMAAAQKAAARGVLPPMPMVLASDPAAVDPSREVSGLRPLWSYAHVPFGCSADVTEHVVKQIERFAPGFRDLIVASRCVPASEMHEHNANYVGGDIAAGSVGAYRLVARPRPAWDPYSFGTVRTADGTSSRVALCSAAAVPGPGVHGVCGYEAMRTVLRKTFGIREEISLSPTPAADVRLRPVLDV